MKELKIIKNPTKLKGKLNYDLLRRRQQRQLRRINDIFVETELTVKGLNLILEDVNKKKKKDMYIIRGPSSKGSMVDIYRRNEEVASLLRQRAERKEYIQSLVFAISLVEDYIAKTLILMIKSFPPKLLISVKGQILKDDQAFSVDVRDIIKLGSIEKIILDKAERRVRDAMYGSPVQYAEYCKAILGFELSEDTWKKYIEIKATRDIFIHDDGRANAIYLSKTGPQARAAEGERLIVDSAYLQSSISCIKLIFSEIYSGLRDGYLDNKELHANLVAEG